MADDIKYLRHTVEDIDIAINMILEMYTREEINAKLATIEERISKLEKDGKNVKID